MRGKPQPRPCCQRTPGITPACAGKTDYAQALPASSEDHPRVCGENPVANKLHDIFRGSPPRVRGKRTDYVLRIEHRRITPACAGKTVPFVKQRKCKEDHPRVCGENWIIARKVTIRPGSPPRVRGKLFCLTPTSPQIGITPACAGKTWKRRTLYKFH